MPKEQKNYKNKNNAQNAHEAIRPTYVDKTPESIKEYLTNEQYKLYKLIWERFVASQMASAQLEQTTIVTRSGKYDFTTSGTIVTFKMGIWRSTKKVKRMKKPIKNWFRWKWDRLWFRNSYAQTTFYTAACSLYRSNFN